MLNPYDYDYNSPLKSKINWTGLFIQIVGLLVIFKLLPPEMERPIVEITLILGPAIIQVWRSWFTNKKPKSKPKEKADA